LDPLIGCYGVLDVGCSRSTPQHPKLLCLAPRCETSGPLSCVPMCVPVCANRLKEVRLTTIFGPLLSNLVREFDSSWLISQVEPQRRLQGAWHAPQRGDKAKATLMVTIAPNRHSVSTQSDSHTS